ncbi:tetratricopeptide repeat protein 5-like [Dromaius novaehollandiae]|uniref:tetratricopeptide repeat protein 5-like n=1 Tax=Dromaius novaehollandiae TaxID=8790 RepID=UPI00311D6FCA
MAAAILAGHKGGCHVGGGYNGGHRGGAGGGALPLPGPAAGRRRRSPRRRSPRRRRPGDGDPGDGRRGDGGPGDAEALLEEEVERTLRRMEQVQVSPGARGQALVLRARALSAVGRPDARAEAALGRALKLAPGLPEAWTRLGEAAWRRGDPRRAQACFAGALRHGPDKEALRCLSMALRQAGRGPGAVRESVEHAKAAVRLDPADGRSWYVLGNAYVSLFFACGQSPEAARRALGAYAQAEKVDPEAAKNPDLHLNRATLLQYEERYGAALDGFARAAALEPGWAEPRLRHGRLLDYLGRLCALLANRGKVGGRRLRGLLAPLPPALLGPLGRPGGPSPAPVAALRPGPNPGRALLGRVLFSLTPHERVPFTLGLADGAGTAVAVCVYNAAPGWGVLVGDAVAVPEPHLRQHHVQHQGQSFSFAAVRVATPLGLVVNGRCPRPQAQAPAGLACRPPPPGATSDDVPPPPPRATNEDDVPPRATANEDEDEDGGDVPPPRPATPPPRGQ